MMIVKALIFPAVWLALLADYLIRRLWSGLAWGFRRGVTVGLLHALAALSLFPWSLIWLWRLGRDQQRFQRHLAGAWLWRAL